MSEALTMPISGTKHTLLNWLVTLPPESIDRLRTINLSTDSSRHVILTVAYGMFDANIRRIGRVITYLLIARMKAQRAGRETTVARINAYMDRVHTDIDVATGTVGMRRSSEHTCRRPKRAQAT